MNGFIILLILLYFNQFPPPRCRHASFHERSENRRLVKPRDMKKEISPFMFLSCGLGRRRISALPGLHKAVASRQGFIPRGTSHTFPLTNPRHTLLSCTIFLACLTSKPFFFKQSFTDGFKTRYFQLQSPFQLRLLFKLLILILNYLFRQ